ncbi:MAG: hypothetical protein V1781_08750 [Bacteroidota bacterium]
MLFLFRLYFFCFLFSIFLSCKNSSNLSIADNPQKTKYKETFFGKKEKRIGSKQKDEFKVAEKKKNSKLDNSFSSKTETKDYGRKANGKRLNFFRRQNSKDSKLENEFTANIGTADYGEKAFGKPSKKSNDKKEDKTLKENDAFTSSVTMDSNSPNARMKGKKTKVKKKRKLFHFRSKEERQRDKIDNNPFNNDPRIESKERKQKIKKKEYGLGIPRH